MTGRALLDKLNAIAATRPEVLDNFDLSFLNDEDEFFSIRDIAITGDGTIDEIADGVVEEGSPVFLGYFE